MNCYFFWRDDRLILLIGVSVFLLLFYLWAHKQAKVIVASSPEKKWVLSDINRWALLIFVIDVLGFFKYFSKFC